MKNDLLSRVAELRRSFDRAFAEPPPARADDVQGFVQIRVGPHPYAVRVSEISGLHADRRVVPVPTPLPELRGITSLRAGLFPVYGLRVLLGHAATSDATRWLLTAGEIGLAFDDFEGHARVDESSIAQAHGDGARAHVREMVRIAGALRPVLSVASVVSSIKQTAAATLALKEL